MAAQPSLNALTDRAQALRAEGRHAEAVDALGAIIDLAPDNVAVLHNYAAALGDAGRNREAVEVLDRAFARGLNAPESWLVYARALSGAQRFEEAEAAFLKLFQHKPYDPDVHREFAQLIWMRTGDRDRALALLNRAIASRPSAGGLHIARAQVYGQTGDHDTEYKVVQKAVAAAGDDPHLLYAACRAASAADDFEAALDYGRRAVAARPDDTGVSGAYCTALLGAGEAAEAARVAETLRARAPLNQLFIALQATAWRLAGDARSLERYEAVFDFDAFVRPFELDAPAGWSSLEAYVDDLAAALDEAHCFKSHPFNQSVRHGSQIAAVDGAENPALRAYREAAAGPVRAYIEALGPGEDALRSRNLGAARFYSLWSISLPPNGFHANHVHPEGWLSSACHVRPSAPDPTSPHAGQLKFGEPGVAVDPPLAPQKFIEPRAGVLVIFPSYMWHGTVPFVGGAPRLSIAGDIVPVAGDSASVA